MRLQGHRKRRRVPEISGTSSVKKLDWLEYKTIRQYQTMGDLLEDLRSYGSCTVKPSSGSSGTGKNGHNWLTQDPDR